MGDGVDEEGLALCLSMGQVYAIHGLVPSLIIWLAVALYNPLLAALSAAGALMGSFLPLLLLGIVSVSISNNSVKIEEKYHGTKKVS